MNQQRELRPNCSLHRPPASSSSNRSTEDYLHNTVRCSNDERWETALFWEQHNTEHDFVCDICCMFYVNRGCTAWFYFFLKWYTVNLLQYIVSDVFIIVYSHFSQETAWERLFCGLRSRPQLALQQCCLWLLSWCLDIFRVVWIYSEFRGFSLLMW